MRIGILVIAGVLVVAILFIVFYHRPGEQKSPEPPAIENSSNEPVELDDTDEPEEPALKGDVSRGQELATGLCGGCHAIPPATVSPQPPAPPFAEVAGRWPLDDLAEALAEGIVVGHEGHVIMPEFSFDPQQIEDLLAYMQSVKK